MKYDKASGNEAEKKPKPVQAPPPPPRKVGSYVLEHGLFIKHEFKVTGYWPSFFVCVLDQDGIKIHKLANKNKPNIQSS